MSLKKSTLRIFVPWIMLLLVNLVQAQAAAHIQIVFCGVINGIYTPLSVIGGSLVLLMIVYAGVKYVYSADDPGGRKQAKDIIVHSIIGGIILVIAIDLWGLITGLVRC